MIVPTEGAQTTYYKLNELGGKIGRHSINQIVIMEESVSRSHAEIVFNGGFFSLKDTRSSTGTFIKVSEHQSICVGMIIEMGSNQYIIEQIQVNFFIRIKNGPSKWSCSCSRDPTMVKTSPSYSQRKTPSSR